MNDNLTKDENRVMSGGAVLGYLLLLNLGWIGIICSIIFACDKTYIARRNMARAMLIFKAITFVLLFGISMILSLLTAYDASSSTVKYASHAKFAQEFGEYSDQFAITNARTRSEYGLKGEILSEAQEYYITANGIKMDDNYYTFVKPYSIPEGYILPESIQMILNSNDDNKENTIVAYKIEDNVFEDLVYYNYDSNGYHFYGDDNGKETHYTTSDGMVFTLPGFAKEQDDGTIAFYIDSKTAHYYVTPGKSKLTVGQKNVNGDFITEKEPIQDYNLTRKYFELDEKVDRDSINNNYIFEPAASGEITEAYEIIEGY